jgi:hypothetical protein
LIAVLGIDIKIADLKKIDSNYESTLNYLVSRSNVCPPQVPSNESDQKCFMEALRARHQNEFNPIDGNVPMTRCFPTSECKLTSMMDLYSKRQQTCIGQVSIPYPKELVAPTEDQICGDVKCPLDGWEITGIVAGSVAFVAIVGFIYYRRKAMPYSVKKTVPKIVVN